MNAYESACHYFANAASELPGIVGKALELPADQSENAVGIPGRSHRVFSSDPDAEAVM